MGKTLPSNLEWSSGALCLDFLETMEDDHPYVSGHAERLTSFSDLVRWCRDAELLSSKNAEALIEEASGRPRETDKALEWSLALRTNIKGIFCAIAKKSQPKDTHLAGLNSALSRVVSRSRIVPDDGGFTWVYKETENALDRIAWPVVWSATELLTSEDRHLVKQCRSSSCSALFIDTSKNHTRRWCDMTTCGNREKARQHYLKEKSKPRAEK